MAKWKETYPRRMVREIVFFGEGARVPLMCDRLFIIESIREDKMHCKKNMFNRIVPLFFAFFIYGCAHIPQESVQLNQMVGKGIADQNRAYVNLLNEYFELKKKSIDDFIMQTYIPTFMSNLRSKVSKDSALLIPDTAFTKILKKIAAKRDSMQSNLDEVKATIIGAAQENAMLLSNANSAVSALLKSAVSVDKATKAAMQAADSLSGSKFKFSEFGKTFDQYLIEVGNGSAKANSLYDKTNQLLNGGQ